MFYQQIVSATDQNNRTGFSSSLLCFCSYSELHYISDGTLVRAMSCRVKK